MYLLTLKYIILELIEKVFRLKSFIKNNSSKQDNNSNKAVISLFEKVIKTIFDNIQNLIVDIKYLDENSTSFEIFAIQQELSLCFSAITELHEQINFLSTNWLKLETYTFIEQIYKKYFNQDKSKKVNIILSNDYDFTETNLDKRFHDILEIFFKKQDLYIPEENPTVIIPKIEYSNPLNWPILIHELGHADTKNINKLTSNTEFPKKLSEDENKQLKKWAEEIYCDVIATKIIGSAYFLSLATFSLLQSLVIGYGASSKSHPPFVMRLALLHSYLDKNNLLIEKKLPDGSIKAIHYFIYAMNYIINDNIKNTNLAFAKEPDNEDLMDFEIYIRSSLIKNDSVIKNIESIPILLEKLQNGIPIGSYRSNENKDELILKLENPKLKKKEFNSIKCALTERNTELWEILNVGWIFKICDIVPFGLDLFFDNKNKTFEKKVDLYGTKLEILDDRLLTSIELSKLIDIIEN